VVRAKPHRRETTLSLSVPACRKLDGCVSGLSASRCHAELAGLLNTLAFVSRMGPPPPHGAASPGCGRPAFHGMVRKAPADSGWPVIEALRCHAGWFSSFPVVPP